MRNFAYHRARSAEGAIAAAAGPAAALLAGGTTLIDLAKCGVAEPDTVVDITGLGGLDTIRADASGAEIGALATMSRVAENSGIRSHFPAVAESLLLAASAQIRNMATIGGNLMQRTRCVYFRDPATFPACNKRNPGSGCAAIGGANDDHAAIGGVTRNHAVLGTSAACIATYPGDLAVALMAFDAVIHVAGPAGTRQIAIDDFFLLPGDTPDREHPLAAGELITTVTIPGSVAARRSTYLKVRDRQSYEFAAASAAAGLELEADGQTIREVRLALGGIATKPWRARAVEDALRGRILAGDVVAQACKLAVEGAVDQGDNAYKITLAPRVAARAILTVGGMA